MLRRFVRYLLTLTLVSFSVWVAAQIPTSTVSIGWDLATPPPAGYRVAVDNVIRDVGIPPINPRCNCYAVAVPAIPGTPHTITVSSYTASGEVSEPSAPLILPSACLPGRNLHDCWNVEPSVPMWQATDIGVSAPVGRSAVTPSGSFTLESGGLGLQSAADTAYLVHREITGDGTLTARINSLSAGVGGIQWRETTAPGARHVSLGYRAAGNLEATVRTTAGNVPTVVTVQTDMTPPMWLRLSRVGDNFTAEFSRDRSVWEQVGTVRVTMPARTRLGLFTASNRTDAVTIGQFDDVVRIP